MDLLCYFFVSLGISFLGSIPIGLISLTIVQRTIEKGKKSGFMIAAGATIMEFVYTFIALKSLDLFTENLDLGNYIKIISTVIFFIIGAYYFFKQPSEVSQPETKYDYFDFLRGFVVGFMNVLIVPFWIFIGVWLQTNGMEFVDNGCISVFSLGSALGALLAFISYIWFSGLIEGRLLKIKKYTNKIFGLLFFGLGIYQLFQIM